MLGHFSEDNIYRDTYRDAGFKLLRLKAGLLPLGGFTIHWKIKIRPKYAAIIAGQVQIRDVFIKTVNHTDKM